MKFEHEIGSLVTCNDHDVNMYDSPLRMVVVGHMDKKDLCLVLDRWSGDLKGSYYKTLSKNGTGWSHEVWLESVK